MGSVLGLGSLGAQGTPANAELSGSETKGNRERVSVCVCARVCVRVSVHACPHWQRWRDGIWLREIRQFPVLYLQLFCNFEIVSR